MNDLPKSHQAILIAIERGYSCTKEGLIITPKYPDGYKGNLNSKNYYDIRLEIDGKPVQIKVHRLQAYQKFGDQIFDKTYVVRHLNNDKTDNSWDNIEIGTMKDNWLDDDLERRNCFIFHNQTYDHNSIVDFLNLTKSKKLTREKFGCSRHTIDKIIKKERLDIPKEYKTKNNS